MDGAWHWRQTMAALGLYAAAADKFTPSVRAYSCVTRVHLHHTSHAYTCITRVTHVYTYATHVWRASLPAEGAAVPSASAIFCKNATVNHRTQKLYKKTEKVEKTMSIAASVGRIGQLYVAFWIEPPVLAQAARSICVAQGCEDARIENMC